MQAFLHHFDQMDVELHRPIIAITIRDYQLHKNLSHC